VRACGLLLILGVVVGGCSGATAPADAGTKAQASSSNGASIQMASSEATETTATATTAVEEASSSCSPCMNNCAVLCGTDQGCLNSCGASCGC
jgi:hypothetical protein